jgi:hypothetical protein
VLGEILGPKREEIIIGWMKWHNEESHDLYSSPNVIWVIKSRRMRWAGQVACMGGSGMHTGLWRGSLMARDNVEGLAMDGRIILIWILNRL